MKRHSILFFLLQKLHLEAIHDSDMIYYFVVRLGTSIFLPCDKQSIYWITKMNLTFIKLFLDLAKNAFQGNPTQWYITPFYPEARDLQFSSHVEKSSIYWITKLNLTFIWVLCNTHVRFFVFSKSPDIRLLFIVMYVVLVRNKWTWSGQVSHGGWHVSPNR